MYLHTKKYVYEYCKVCYIFVHTFKGVNFYRSWIHRDLSKSQFSLVKVKYFEHDFFSAISVKESAKVPPLQVVKVENKVKKLFKSYLCIRKYN